VQVNPPGIYLCNVGGPAFFVNDSSRIWYLYRNKHHSYEWVDSKDGEIVPFAVEVGQERLGFLLYIARIVRKDEPVLLGIVVPFMGVLYYPDEFGNSKSTRTGYQVLTCRSCRKEAKILPPKFFDTNLTPNVDRGCSEFDLF
jgi:hypothetical protein